MTSRNIVQRAFDDFGTEAGLVKRSGSWYANNPETILVINLQKSQYGDSYYINVGLWLNALETQEFPKEHHCHIRTRLTRIVPATLEEHLEELLDLGTPIGDDVRSHELLEIFRSTLFPLISATATLGDLRSGEGERLVEAALVEGDAVRLLARAS